MKKFLLLVVMMVLVGLAFPVLNLVVKPDNSGKLAPLQAGDATFAPVATLLEEKCAGCHLPGAALPFYASFPIAGGMIGEDIDLGLRYFDFSADLLADENRISEVALAKLEHVLEAGTMPPGRYTALHWDGGLNGKDVKTLREWIHQLRGEHYATGKAAAKHANAVVQPLVPFENLDPKIVELGDRLFHDTALSGDDTVSCASCHGLDIGGTDRLQFSTGIRGQVGGINSPTVYNAAYALDQFWDGRAADLVEQAAGPVENPIEMDAKWPDVVEKLKGKPEYVASFDELFNGQLTAHNVQVAIATFEESLITTGSRFDKFLMGDDGAITPEEKEGYESFVANGCAACHVGSILGGQSYELMGRYADYFADRGDVGDADQGRFSHTGVERDRHRFKVPTLRNVAVTYPYFHDGTTSDLTDAVRTMAGYNCGTELSEAELAGIVAFLKSLTGEYQGQLLE